MNENKKICSVCKKTLGVKKIILETCQHKFCYSCFFSHFEDHLKLDGFPITCPNSYCNSFIGFEFAQKVLNPDDIDQLMNNLRLCSSCINYKPKSSMIRPDKCKHKKCQKCWNNYRECYICLREYFNKKRETERAEKFNKDSSEMKKKECAICNEKSQKYKKFSCCNEAICLDCSGTSFGKQMKKAETKENFKEFILRCPNKNCKEKLQEDEIDEEILDEEQKKLFNLIFQRKKCRICKIFKNFHEEIIELEACSHKICKECLNDYMQISLSSNNENSICPVKKCHYLINFAQLENNEYFRNISKIYRIEKENESIPNEKHVLLNENNKICLAQMMNCEICKNDCTIQEMLTLNCEHRFCQKCLIEHSQTKIQEGLISDTHLICPKEGCHEPINYYILKGNLPKELFDKYDVLLLKHVVANSPENNLNNSEEISINCPDCSIEYFIDKKISYFECVICRKTYCANKKCLKKWSEHQGLPCEYLKGKSDWEEEQKFEEYVKKNNLKRCPVCDAVIEKTKNCNYIQCNSIKCQKKTTFCYLCREILQQKDLANHFVNNSPFSKCKKMGSNKTTKNEEQKTSLEEKVTKNKEIQSLKLEEKNELIKQELSNKEKEKNIQKNSRNALQNSSATMKDLVETKSGEIAPCPKCFQSFEYDHGTINIDYSTCYFICGNNVFCQDCWDAPVNFTCDWVSLISHFHNHCSQYHPTNQAQVLINSFVGERKSDLTKFLSNPKNKNKPIYDFYKCITCQKNLSEHQSILLENSVFPVCEANIQYSKNKGTSSERKGYKMLTFLYCELCKISFNFQDIDSHVGNDIQIHKHD